MNILSIIAKKRDKKVLGVPGQKVYRKKERKSWQSF